MKKDLTKDELEALWAISFADEDAEMCFAVDDEYKQRFGMLAWHIWVNNRL